jgi:hypothetical protein
VEIRAAGEFRFDDMLRACRALLVRRKWIWNGVSVLGWLMAAVCLFLTIILPLSLSDTLPAILIGILWGTVLWWAPFLTARKQWRNNRVLPGRHEFLFNDGGLTRQGANSSVSLKWTGIHSWREDKYLFTLFTSPGGAVR